MPWPKQPAQIDDHRRARAPYNFVALPEKVATLTPNELPDQDRFHTIEAKRYSGWLDCTLTTASPVYVRAALTPEEQKKGKQSKDLPEFFYIWEKNCPVIPGSTLRGLLRALVEIASFSRVSDVSESRLVYRAVGDTTSHGTRYRERVMRTDPGTHHYTPKMLGGYIRKKDSDWCIQPAREIGGTTFARIRIDEPFFNQLTRVAGCKNAYQVWVKAGPYQYHDVRGTFLHVRAARVIDRSRHQEDETQGWIAGTLARSGDMFSKRTEAVVYPPDTTQQLLHLSDDQIEDYREQVSQEQEKILGGKQGVLTEGQPVFYTLTGNGAVDFFGHCRMLRLPYPQPSLLFVPESVRGEKEVEARERLENEPILDLAEAIFGYTKKLKKPETTNAKPADVPAKAQRYAGRIAVSAAHLLDANDKDIWLAAEEFIPKILASPKPTTFQHYLVQAKPNKVKVWRDGKEKWETQLEDYSAEPEKATVIRGHKLYWHKGPVKQNDLAHTGKVKEKQVTRLRPLRAGIKFAFRVHFDNLSQEEAGALLWVLQIAADPRYRLKVGMGKPLGMGAVKIESHLTLIDRAKRYTQLFAGPGWSAGEVPATETERLRQECIAEFEDFVLCELNAPESIQQLAQLERIRQLLALLSWPGPRPEETRYLEIERPDPKAKRGKVNEYDGRPVLPDPLSVIGATRPVSHQPTTTRNKPMSELPPGFKRGTVKNFGLGPSQSFGFITPADGSKDVFVHRSALPKGVLSLTPGQSVIYSQRNGPHGPEATAVQLASANE